MRNKEKKEEEKKEIGVVTTLVLGKCTHGNRKVIEVFLKYGMYTIRKEQLNMYRHSL